MKLQENPPFLLDLEQIWLSPLEMILSPPASQNWEKQNPNCESEGATT